MTNPTVVPYLDNLTPEDFNYLVDSINRSNTALSQQIKQAATPVATTTNNIIFNHKVDMPATSVATDSNALNGNSDGGYDFEFQINHVQGKGTVNYSIYFNNDQTAADYTSNSTQLGVGTNAIFLQLSDSSPVSYAHLVGKIFIDLNGFVSFASYGLIFNAGAILGTSMQYVKKTISVVNLNSIAIVASVADSIDTKSLFKLKKWNL